MNKCIDCFYFESLDESFSQDRNAADRGCIGFCNVDGLYKRPDYSCDYDIFVWPDPSFVNV